MNKFKDGDRVRIHSRDALNGRCRLGQVERHSRVDLGTRDRQRGWLPGILGPGKGPQNHERRSWCSNIRCGPTSLCSSACLDVLNRLILPIGVEQLNLPRPHKARQRPEER